MGQHPPSARDRLQAMLASQDGPMLRFGLARACLAENETALAEQHLRRAVEQKPDYSAAWVELGKLLEKSDPEQAQTAWRNGLEAARHNGDKQIERQLEVFLKRLDNKA